MSDPINPYALGTWNGERVGEADGHGATDGGPGADTDNGAGGEGDAPWIIARDDSARVSDFSRPDEFGRRALNHARAVAKKNGYVPRARVRRGTGNPRDRSSSAPGYSGARPDPRDPQKIGDVLSKVLGELGWDDGLSTGRVIADWEGIVGPAIADHCRIVSFEDGILQVSADSSAWAAQLRMLTPQLITRIHEHVGRHVIDELRVAGPAAARWKKGKRSVTWQGPRDTYG